METKKVKTNSIELFNLFLQLDRTYSLGTVGRAVRFILSNENYIANDFGVNESDFNLYKDILLTHNPAKISSNLIAGIYFGTSNDLVFKFRR